MVTLQFPKIEKLLLPTSIDQNLNYKKGVLVLNKSAIIITSNLIAVCDLEDLFLSDEDDIVKIEKINSILDYMNGKVFPASYWSELTKKQLVGLDEESDTIYIKGNGYSKELNNHLGDFNKLDVINILNACNVKQIDQKENVNYYMSFDNVKRFISAFSNVLKVDDIKIEFRERNAVISSLRHNVYCFISMNEEMETMTVQEHLNTF